jgi:hypothetical protein
MEGGVKMLTTVKCSDGTYMPLWSPDPEYKIISGKHIGREGKIVRTEWFSLRVTLIVHATKEESIERYGEGWGDRVEETYFGSRSWITVWRWQTELIPTQVNKEA